MIDSIAKIILVFCLLNVSNQKSVPKSQRSPFELDEFLNDSFFPKTWNGSWITDSSVWFLNKDKDILIFDVTTKQSEVFVTSQVLDNYPNATVTLSPDLSYVLITYNVSAIFRHSTTAQFAIYDVANKKYYDIANSTPLQLVKFALQGHGLVYVQDNNIYYLDNFAVDIQNPIPVTTIGALGTVYCGVPDWVYEEEVLISKSALWFSRDANHIAYAVFHDENVTDFSYTLYGKPSNLEYQYPHEAVIKYPKVGTSNPLVSIYVFNTETRSTVEFQLPPSISNKDSNDYILYGLSWISDMEVAMISTNRAQNESIIIRCLVDGQCIEEMSHKETKGWIELTLPIYSKDGTKNLQILPQPEGDDEYDHLVLIESNVIKRLTYGKRSVIQIYGWDENSGLIYYQASVNDTPSQQHVYSVDKNGKSECLTCEITVDDVPCTCAGAQFSPKLSYYVKTCFGPFPYFIQVQSTKNVNDVFVWEDNAELRKNLSTKYQPVIKNLLVPINDQFTARVRLFLPPNLDVSSGKKYPAIVYTYGGPNTNQISDAYNSDIQNYMVTNREYIWILIDGRGTGRDGHNKMFQMYRHFATVEIEDQIQVTKYLQENLQYIDAKKTGIWGWSYGGFCSSWVLAKDADHVFLFALSVAPVTNFVYYDTIYTERYMGLLSDNEAGYNATDLSREAEAFRGRNYFVIHGNGDDNVHYQNSMLFIKTLEEADIYFRQHSYPDENHSLGGVTRHLYHMIDKYWAEQFRVEAPLINSWNLKETRSEYKVLKTL